MLFTTKYRITVRIKPEMTVPQSESSGFFIDSPSRRWPAGPNTAKLSPVGSVDFIVASLGQLNPAAWLPRERHAARAQRGRCLPCSLSSYVSLQENANGNLGCTKNREIDFIASTAVSRGCARTRDLGADA